MKNDEKIIPLESLVSKTLTKVRANFSGRKNALYILGAEKSIRNNSNIDLSPKYDAPKDDFERRQVKNKTGWISVNRDYIVKPGDEGSFNVFTYYHKACNREHLKESYQEKFKDLFEKAGFESVSLQAIHNEYCQCDSCAPWFNVESKFGVIKIGWRKRVINIDWSGLQIRDISSLFEKENVSKGRTFIHAWDLDKAEEYLSKINKCLLATI